MPIIHIVNSFSYVLVWLKVLIIQQIDFIYILLLTLDCAVSHQYNSFRQLQFCNLYSRYLPVCKVCLPQIKIAQSNKSNKARIVLSYITLKKLELIFMIIPA